MFRNDEQKPSRWLAEDFFDSICTVDNRTVRCFNDPNSMARLIYENETAHGIGFFSEGLICTYPTEKFEKKVRKLIDDCVPEELKILRFCDVNSKDIEDTNVLIDSIDKDKPHNGISPSIVFLVPLFKRSDTRKILNRFIDDTHIYGYDVTSINKYENDLRDDVDIFMIQYEAKRYDWKFELNDVLYHVSPLSRLYGISKRGLVPRSCSNEFKYEDRVYVFNKCPIETVIKYGNFKIEDTDERGFCLFVIMKDKLVNDQKYKNGKIRFYADSVFHDSTRIDVEAMFTYNNIDLRFLEDYCFVFNRNDPSHPKKINFKE